MLKKIVVVVGLVTAALFGCLALTTGAGVVVLALRQGLQVQGPAVYWAEPAATTRERPTPAPEATEAPIVTAPTAPEIAHPADLCAGLRNPVWSAVMARNNGMLQANYTAWMRDVLARGGNVFDAATCVPAARLVNPGGEIAGAGIWQLITVPAEGPDTWANHGSFEYEVAPGCQIEGFGAQGDNPAALFTTTGKAVMEVFNSTGTSLLVQATCR